jgi:hypothetical protein
MRGAAAPDLAVLKLEQSATSCVTEVTLRSARLRPDVRPSDLQALLEENVTTPVRTEPSISLEEVDRDEVVVRIAATPLSDGDGARLADEVLAAIASVTGEVDGAPRAADARRQRTDPYTQEFES